MADDPYKYFRIEARELLEGLTQGVLELESGTADRQRVRSLLRLAHTLKGASRVVRQPAIAELTHGIEDLLAPFREGISPVPKERAREVLEALDQIGAGLAALSPAPHPVATAAPRPVNEEVFETVRVEVEEVDLLLARLARAGTELTGIENGAEALGRARRVANLLVQQVRSRPEGTHASATPRVRALAEQLLDSLRLLETTLTGSVERLERESGQARELATGLRLLSVSTIFPALVRAARDASVSLGKQVQLETAGGDLRLDADVLATIREALLHLVRNAVAHGIETEQDRISAGKSVCGRIEIRVERRGQRAAFLCRDDGAGFDLGAIRRMAVKIGVISPAKAESLVLPEAIDLLQRGGVSTTDTPTEISGRGIGLEIVRAAVNRLKGDITVETASGRGATVEVCVPVSMSAVQSLMLNAGGVAASIPLASVLETTRIEGRDIVRAGDRESMVYRGRMIPFLPLSTVLGRQSTVTRGDRWPAAIVTSGSRLAAIGVDRLVRTGTILIHALPALAPATALVSGATLDRDGNPELVLDTEGLIEAAYRGLERKPGSNTPSEPILVIDDSLTTRMVEQSILESAGYRVEIATSGEEGLEKARAQNHSLFLVDVEMPGIDGFEFVARTRADPVLRATPAILVTSRMSADDRRRGTEAGAYAHIVKSEFDQGSFLQMIHQLVRA